VSGPLLCPLVSHSHPTTLLGRRTVVKAPKLPPVRQPSRAVALSAVWKVPPENFEIPTRRLRPSQVVNLSYPSRLGLANKSRLLFL
jgi:hypothetical protein